MVGLVKVHPPAGRIATNVSVIALKPTDFVEHHLIGDVGGVAGVVRIRRRDVNHRQIRRPFGAHFQQEFGRRGAIGQENFDIIVDLVLERHPLLSKDSADDDEQHEDGTGRRQYGAVKIVEF